MPDNQDGSKRSRRSFLFGGSDRGDEKPEKVKMLTPDGRLVEIDKHLIDAARQNKKASKKDIFNWMRNPSKGEG